MKCTGKVKKLHLEYNMQRMERTRPTKYLDVWNTVRVFKDHEMKLNKNKAKVMILCTEQDKLNIKKEETDTEPGHRELSKKYMLQTKQ